MLGRLLTALVTPFQGGEPDEEAFAAFVAWQIAQGTEALVTGSLTGEGPTLTIAEHGRLLAIAVAASAGRVPVIAATGSNSTATTVELTRQAKAAGADAALVVTPYYNRPSQEGLYRHFEAVARAVDLPLLIHNAPKRTAVDLLHPTLERLVRLPSIVGIVDGTGDPARAAANRDVAGSTFPQWCEQETQAVAFAAVGGHGCLSSLANVVPRLCATLQETCGRGEYEAALAIQRKLEPLAGAFGPDMDAGAIKCAVALLRPNFSRYPRLPLAPCTSEAGIAIAAALRSIMDEDSP